MIGFGVMKIFEANGLTVYIFKGNARKAIYLGKVIFEGCIPAGEFGKHHCEV